MLFHSFDIQVKIILNAYFLVTSSLMSMEILDFDNLCILKIVIDKGQQSSILFCEVLSRICGQRRLILDFDN